MIDTVYEDMKKRTQTGDKKEGVSSRRDTNFVLVFKDGRPLTAILLVLLRGY